MRFHGSLFMNKMIMMGYLTLASMSMMIASCSGFAVPNYNGLNQRMASMARDEKMRLYGKLWEKLGIPEDIVDWTDEEIEAYDDEEEDRGPYWYVMNCVAGLELELYEQARITQAKLEAEEETNGLIQQIKVPREKTLKSFGTKRTVVEDKVLYPGYVFLKMYLTEKTYEPLQQLPLCRSWMGTIHRKGLYTKLPSIPMALNPEEVQKFQGLENNPEADEEELLKQYGGYRVEDMVKILKGNFAKEDGVIRRLKDGKVMVRLYTYGSTYDEWMPIDHVRKMTDVEAMQGLTGPTAPITSNDLDPNGNNFSRDGRETRKKQSDSPFSQPIGGMKNTNNQRRMRRQDRVSRGETNRRNDDPETLRQEKENWRQYREQQRQQPSKNKQKESWGLQEQSSWNSKENFERALEGDDDWSDYTSSKSSEGNQQNKEDDDFFNSLMDELSSSLEDTSSNSRSTPTSANPSSNRDNHRQPKQEKDEDDFFSSLMNELEGDLTPSPSSPPSKKKNKQQNEEDDFFASLEADLNDSLGNSKKEDNNNEDDFFASLEADLNDSLSAETNTKSSADEYGEDDFFASLEADLNSQLDTPPSKALKNNNDDENDFFASLDPPSPVEEEKPKEEKKSTTATNASSNMNLGKLTVPILKEMCRERGLKLSGKKADLIERLSQ